VFATLEFIIGVVLLFITIGSIWLSLPGGSLNSWILKHGAVEAMFPLFIITSLAFAVAAFAISIQ
jgi:hypothetical protein